jgi:hypothetical protein
VIFLVIASWPPRGSSRPPIWAFILPAPPGLAEIAETVPRRDCVDGGVCESSTRATDSNRGALLVDLPWPTKRPGPRDAIRSHLPPWSFNSSSSLLPSTTNLPPSGFISRQGLSTIPEPHFLGSPPLRVLVSWSTGDFNKVSIIFWFSSSPTPSLHLPILQSRIGASPTFAPLTPPLSALSKPSGPVLTAEWWWLCLPCCAFLFPFS